jgi:hypothetical protein
MGEHEAIAKLTKEVAEQKHELEELRAWKVKNMEAAELWGALQIGNNQHVDKALLIAKVVDFGKGGGPMITASVTDGCDWVDEWGLISSWQAISNASKEYDTTDPDD